MPTVSTPPPPDFQRLFEAAPGLYLVLTAELRIVAVSDAYLKATMTERASILGRRLFEVFPDNPDDLSATGTSNLRASLQRVLDLRRQDSMAVQKYDIRRPESEGGGFEERFWSPVNSPVFRPDGQVEYIIHRVEDVTEFVRLEQRGSEHDKLAEELRSRMDRMSAEVLSRAQEIQEVNQDLRKLKAELEDRVSTRTLDLQRANEALQLQIKERQRTEEALRRSEDHLRQAQKLEAVGRLAGGVAHDFNNLLTVILSYSETVREELGEGHHCAADLNEIHQAGERAAALTHQLLAFSRQQVLDPQVLNFNRVLEELSPMLARVIGEDIELRTTMTPNLHSVLADRSQIEQVIMNLLVNARDAMPEGGKITLETANITLSEEYARDHVEVKPGPHVLLAVSDTGTGMDKRTQARIFEPFFTTKERGKGTGLGLSTVFGIVQQSGGHIWVYSEPGAGTTFKIYFPRAQATPGVVEPPAPFAATVRGSETILLAEDEAQVRGVVSAILCKNGYVVLEADTGAAALEICGRHPTLIHLLLTDVIMPKMNGRQLAERVVAARPDTRVLFMSGYTDDVIVHHGVLDVGAHYIQKPITPESLARKVREVLDGAARVTSRT